MKSKLQLIICSFVQRRVLSHCRPFIPLPQKLFFTSDVNGLHETKDYVSCGSVILCFEVIVVTREELFTKIRGIGTSWQARFTKPPLV